MEAQVQEERRLPVGYYTDNFLRLLHYVQERYADLLKTDEDRFIQTFVQLSQDAQRLYVRLVSRRSVYFQRDLIAYEEISSLTRAVEELELHGFLFSNQMEDEDLVLECFTRPVLLHVTAALYESETQAFLKRMRKGELIRWILDHGGMEFWEACLSQHPIVWIQHKEKVELFRLLFFGNLRQDFSDFILEDIGVLRYESYDIRSVDRFFDTRETVDMWMHLAELQSQVWLLEQLGDTEYLETFGKHLIHLDVPERLVKKKEKILLKIGLYLEKAKLLEKALFFLTPLQVHPAQERCVRILDKQGDVQQALRACDEILAQATHYYTLEFARSFKQKMLKKLSLPYEKATRSTHAKAVITLKKRELVSVEQAVLAHWNSSGYQGVHDEGRVWKAIFGLTFWEVIFSPQTGVFFNPFQSGPVDVFSTEFAEKRAESIEKVLESMLTSEVWKMDVLRKFQLKQQVLNPFVHWKHIRQQDIEHALRVVPVAHFIAVFKRLLINPGEFQSGFPDLFMYNKEEQRYIWIEVKGPGDTLQPNQSRWLRYLKEHGIPYLVQHVKWEED